MAQKQPVEKPISPERCWIKYQLSLRGIKYPAIAEAACRTDAFVCQVVCGRRRSKRVEVVIAEVLGYASWDELIKDANKKGEVA